jgi:hypothetical protein
MCQNFTGGCKSDVSQPILIEMTLFMLLHGKYIVTLFKIVKRRSIILFMCIGCTQ